MNFKIATRHLSSNTKSQNIFLYYDVISPYSWFGFEILQRYQTYWKDVNIILKPVLLGAVFKATQASPPPLSKVNYSRIDLARGAKHYNVPLKPIKNVGEIIGKGSLLPMRFLTAAKMYQADHLVSTSRGLYMRRFNNDKDISTANDIREVSQMIGMPENIIDSLLDSAQTREVKTALIKSTEESISYGAFGVPTMVTEIENKMEMFFGADRIAILAEEIGKEWKGPNPS